MEVNKAGNKQNWPRVHQNGYACGLHAHGREREGACGK